ncbi:hypothetical protein LCGC14_1552060, partial [marine sediment metagenome]
YVMSRTTGSHRGEPMVFTGKTKIERISWSPKEMDLTPATDRSEERVCALLGIPSAVVGFGSGLEQTKVGATMAELRKLAWQNGIIPLHTNFAGEVGTKLLPQFGAQQGKTRARFDVSDVAALQEDRNKLFQRVDRLVRGGWITVAAGKLAIGMEPGPADDVYLRPINVVTIPSETIPPAPGEDETRAGGDLETKEHEPNAFEQRLLDTMERSAATDAQNAFMASQDRNAPKLAKAMEDELIDFFEDLGRKAAEVAEPILSEMFKQAPEVTISTERIIDAMNMSTIIPIFQEVYEKHYLLVATESTAPAMEFIGLATDIPDPVARAIMATGGTRSGLVELTAKARETLFRAIEEGRALGEGAEALAKRIKQQVPGYWRKNIFGIQGRDAWITPAERAKVIARTETKHAQRVSSLHMGKSQGVTRFRVFDARIGLTDATCAAMDGIVVSEADAQQLAGDEHPNGTRDFVPFFG